MEVGHHCGLPLPSSASVYCSHSYVFRWWIFFQESCFCLYMNPVTNFVFANYWVAYYMFNVFIPAFLYKDIFSGILFFVQESHFFLYNICCTLMMRVDCSWNISTQYNMCLQTSIGWFWFSHFPQSKATFCLCKLLGFPGCSNGMDETTLGQIEIRYFQLQCAHWTFRP